MKISYSWLKELVTFDLSAQDLADKLTLAGFEVEEVQDRATWADGVVVGKIIACAPHPQADKLQVCRVDIGQGEPLQIVCGAANARAGVYIPVAVVGTYLPIKNLTIQKAVLRGVDSTGMLCSLAELGLAKTSEGIHIFDQAYPLGSDVRPILGLTDVILDVTSTANRADALSMVGMAREVAALTEGILRLPLAEVPLIAQGSLSVNIASSQACPVYVATVLENITVAPSPSWLAEKLERAGMRSINNVVDITNLVLLEWGQPLHAFDQALLPVGAIEVRSARPGEELVTLDGVARALGPQNLLITSGDIPVALAGVMGGAATEVRATTTKILLEAALFDPAVTRRSARSQGLRSEASARYERGLDASALEYALARAIALLMELAGGQAIAQTKLDYRSQHRTTIRLRPERVAHILGASLGNEVIEKSLRAYGFDVDFETNENHYLVQVPGFRAREVQTEIDLIEEIARWVGYAQFPSTLPLKGQVGTLAPAELVARQVRSILRGVGLTELFHNSFTPLNTGVALSSKQAQAEARFGPVQTEPKSQSQVALLNPLSADYGALRSELLPGLLGAYLYNLDQGNGALWGFEIGQVTLLQAGDYQEAEHLGAVLGANPTVGDWQHRGMALDFFGVKGMLETLAQALGLRFEYQATAQDSRLHPGRTAQVLLGGEKLGIVGQLHPRLIQAEGFPIETFVFELNLGVLTRQILDRKVRFQGFANFPALDRDLAFFIDRRYSVAELNAAIQAQGGDLLTAVQLFDEYRGQGVPEDQRSLAFRMIYRATDRTLTDKEVNEIQERIRVVLVEQFGVQLRS